MRSLLFAVSSRPPVVLTLRIKKYREHLLREQLKKKREKEQGSTIATELIDFSLGTAVSEANEAIRAAQNVAQGAHVTLMVCHHLWKDIQELPQRMLFLPASMAVFV